MSPLAAWGLGCVVVGSSLALGWMALGRSAPLTRVRLTGAVLAPTQPLVAPWELARTFAMVNRDFAPLRASWPLATVTFDGTTLAVRVRGCGPPLRFQAAPSITVYPSHSQGRPCVTVREGRIVRAKFGVAEQAAFLSMMAAHGFRVDWVERWGNEERDPPS